MVQSSTPKLILLEYRKYILYNDTTESDRTKTYFCWILYLLARINKAIVRTSHRKSKTLNILAERLYLIK
nr:hypothetical protein [uncultured archaeon]